MLSTRFTELVGCTIPIQQAGMGAVAIPELVAAVSNAGGLGMLGTARPGLSPATLTVMLDPLHHLTSRPFGVNSILEPENEIDRTCFELAAKAARVVEFFYGEPDPELVRIVHKHGALACWQAGSYDEAVAAREAGCDIIVVQGIEAGGHVRGRTGLFALLAEVREAVDLPVIAAGGIGTGRTMAAALVAGAEGRKDRHALRGGCGVWRSSGLHCCVDHSKGGGYDLHGGVLAVLGGTAPSAALLYCGCRILSGRHCWRAG